MVSRSRSGKRPLTEERRSFSSISPGRNGRLSSGWANIEAGGMVWNSKTGEIWFSGARASGDASSFLAIHAVATSGRYRLVTRATREPGICDVSRDGRVLLVVSDYPFRWHAFRQARRKRSNLTWLDFSHVVDISEDGRDVLSTKWVRSEAAEPFISVGRTARPRCGSVRAGPWRLSRTASGRSRFPRLGPSGAAPDGSGRAQRNCARMA